MKIIEYKHHVHDYECMWNGIEDLYENASGEDLPMGAFFLLASFGKVCYLKTNKKPIKRMISLGDGRTDKMYEYLSKEVSFSYRHVENKDFQSLLEKVKREIDLGFPVVLGCVDMFYLPYFNDIYRKEHIPFHYLMVNGYDDENRLLFFHDNSRAEQMVLSYEMLSEALNCSCEGLSKPYSFYRIRLEKINSFYQIAKKTLLNSSINFLYPSTSFTGKNAMQAFIQDLDYWNDDLSMDDISKILLSFVQFLGSVPKIPNSLLNIDEKDKISYVGKMDEMCNMLRYLGTKYDDKNLINAESFFNVCGRNLQNLKDIIVKCIKEKRLLKDEMQSILKLYTENMIKACEALEKTSL